MEEVRIDCAHQSAEELALAKEHAQLVFRLNHTMPMTVMMSAGGITIDDDVQIAANVQLISNNHDLEDRMVITCKPIHVCRRAWIGAGATILPGVTVGENSVVGAGSVVTHDVEPDTIVAGNPARIIRKI